MQTMVNNTQLFCQAKGVGTGGTMAPILLETVDFSPPSPLFNALLDMYNYMQQSHLLIITKPSKYMQQSHLLTNKKAIEALLSQDTASKCHLLNA